MLVWSRLSQPQVERITRHMYSASFRMRELLEEFLDRSRSAEKRVEPSDIRELVASAVDKIAVSAEFQSVGIVQSVRASSRGACFAFRLPRTIQRLAASC